MKNRKWIKLWILLILLIPIIGIVNYIIDPLQQYRKASLYDVYYEIKKQRYLNPGLAKTHDYNSILIGSSMTENFLLSDLEKIMSNPVKLSMSGATAFEINTTLNTAFNSKKKLDTVLIGLDLYALSGDKYRLYNGPNSLPLYLYDDKLTNDYKYLFSKDTLKESFRSIKKSNSNKGDLLFQKEHMYQWQHNFENSFGKEKVLKNWTEVKNIDKNQKNPGWSYEKLKESFDFNILSIINKNKSTRFIIFYPPYSILAYKSWNNQNMIDDIIKTKKYINDILSSYNNVELYDFQNNLELISNLDLYKDYTHYHQKVNTKMVDFIKNKEYIVDERYFDKLDIFKEFVKNYEIIK